METFEEPKIVRNGDYLTLYGNKPIFKHIFSIIEVWNGLASGAVYSDSEDEEHEFYKEMDKEKARVERLADWLYTVRTLRSKFNGIYKYSDDEITSLEAHLIKSATKEMDNILEDLDY